MVIIGVGLDGVDQHLGGEDVVAHRHVGLLGIVRRAGRVGGLLHELADAPSVVGVDAPERRRFAARHPDTGDGGPGAALDVLLNHLPGIHPVHVVGTEDHDVVGVFVVDQVQRLVDGVGRARVPAWAEPLLRRNRRDVLAGQAGKPPVLRDVPVQRMRLVLRQNADAQEARVDQVGQHEVDQPIATAEGNRRFGPVRCKGIQPLALPAGQDNAQHMWRFPHGSNLSAGT
jgi:hypothetical protein